MPREEYNKFNTVRLVTDCASILPSNLVGLVKTAKNSVLVSARFGASRQHFTVGTAYGKHLSTYDVMPAKTVKFVPLVQKRDCSVG